VPSDTIPLNLDVIIDPVPGGNCVHTGDIYIQPGGILTIQAGNTLYLNGNLYNAGTLNGTGKIIFSGSSTTLSSSGLISAALYLSNDTVELTSNVNTTDSIVLSNGSFIVLDSFTLNMGSGYLLGDSANYIITNGTGSLTRTIADSTTTSFYVGPNNSSYSPLIISNPTITGNTDTSSLSVRVDSGVFVYGGSNDSIVNTIDTGNVNLTWIVSSTAPAGSSSTVTLGWCTNDEQPDFIQPRGTGGKVSISNVSRCVVPSCKDTYAAALWPKIPAQVLTPITPSCSNTITQTGVPLVSDTLIIGSRSVFVFTGNGDWDSASNWENGAIPPNVIDSGEIVLINCSSTNTGSGVCTFNGDITVMPGGTLQTLAGELKVTGRLIIEQ
jgi:hypothetical protein